MGREACASRPFLLPVSALQYGMAENDTLPETGEAQDPDVERVLMALRPRRRAVPRLAHPLREARDLEVQTPYGPVMAWRLDPWGSSGNAPATLLVHGWEDDNALWGPLIDQLQAVGRPIVALDLPGHGYSQATNCSVGRGAAAVRAVYDALGPIDSVVGHSYGCPLSTQAMADGMKIDRAVLIATGWPNAANSTLWQRIQERLEVSDAVIAKAQAAADESDPFPPFDYEALAARMTAKVLFIHSLDDDGVPPESSRKLADVWPGAALQWTDGLGHRLVAQDDATLQGVVEFLES
jgi:pimeloyl-ACP methyl ester carboxylesterase